MADYPFIGEIDLYCFIVTSNTLKMSELYSIIPYEINQPNILIEYQGERIELTH
jgi:hypothetical protein